MAYLTPCTVCGSNSGGNFAHSTCTKECARAAAVTQALLRLAAALERLEATAEPAPAGPPAVTSATPPHVRVETTQGGPPAKFGSDQPSPRDLERFQRSRGRGRRW